MGPAATEERERRLRRALAALLWEHYGLKEAYDAAREIIEALKRPLTQP